MRHLLLFLQHYQYDAMLGFESHKTAEHLR